MKSNKPFFIPVIIALASLACLEGSFFERIPEQVNQYLPDPGQVATLVIENVEEINAATPALADRQENLEFGMADLESYSIHFVQSLDGKTDSNLPLKVKLVYTQSVINPLRIVHLITESDPDTENANKAEFFRFGNQVYLLSENNICSTYTENLDITSPTEAEFGMSSVFSKLIPGKLLAQGVEVNGIMTDQYEVKELATHQYDLKDIKAQVWYAQDGGFIVKFNGQATGTAISTSQGLKGSGLLQWAYDLRDVNQIADIQLPQPCREVSQGGVNDIPMPENAMDVTKIGSMIIFKAPETVELVTEYYRKEMPLAGYQLKDEIDYEGMFIFNFSKEDENIMIMISSLEDGSEVMITVEMK
jgi:hypothetical protein